MHLQCVPDCHYAVGYVIRIMAFSPFCRFASWPVRPCLFHRRRISQGRKSQKVWRFFDALQLCCRGLYGTVVIRLSVCNVCRPIVANR